MAELADALDSGSSDHYDSCRFKSCFPHQRVAQSATLFFVQNALKTAIFQLKRRDFGLLSHASFWRLTGIVNTIFRFTSKLAVKTPRFRLQGGRLRPTSGAGSVAKRRTPARVAATARQGRGSRQGKTPFFASRPVAGSPLFSRRPSTSCPACSGPSAPVWS